MLIKDDLNNTINLKSVPKRIVSLCPSITETLFYFGLKNNIVAVTDYCIHPKKFTDEKIKIGGPISISIKKIISLKPDLIIASKEENKKSDIKNLSKHFDCFIFSVNSFSSALKMIEKIGVIFNKKDYAKKLIYNINNNFSKINLLKTKEKYLYLVWKSPYMAAGIGNYINSLLCKINLSNGINTCGYPKIDTEIIAQDCKIIFLPSEPFHFNKSDQKELSKKYPDKIILLVDGEMFCWYGARMLKSAKYLNGILNKIKKAL